LARARRVCLKFLDVPMCKHARKCTQPLLHDLQETGTILQFSSIWLKIIDNVLCALLRGFNVGSPR
jgi:hypothetical protein